MDDHHVSEIVGRLTFPTGPLPLPNMVAHCVPPVQHGDTITAGPFHDLLSLKIPKFMSHYLGLPIKSAHPHVAKVMYTKSPSTVQVEKFQTCSTKGIFRPLPPGSHPPHPSIRFSHPVGRVHVNLIDHDQLLWNSAYDLHGKNFLSVTDPPLGGIVPDYIPACAVGKQSLLKLEVDAEWPRVPMNVRVLNPTGGFERGQSPEELGAMDRAPDTLFPLRELQVPDATICKLVKKDHHLYQSENVLAAKTSQKVHLPEPWAEALWRLDRGREETSDLNPHGVPMFDISPKPLETSVKPADDDVPPVAGGHFLARRPTLIGEIQVDQLEKKNFQIFDSRKMPTNIFQVDKSVLLHKPPGFVQPAVAKSRYSSMWQGRHDEVPTQDAEGHKRWHHLHPSFQFKHPGTLAHVTLKSQNRVLWDAVFKVNGDHKIAADQNAVGGLIPEFKGIDPPPGKEQLYSMRIELDNPRDVHSTMSFWRQSEFLFGALRPAEHSELGIRVSGTPFKLF